MMSAKDAEDENWWNDPCAVPPSIDRRWYLVAVAGTSLSLISLVCNILIARVLLTRTHSHFFFLGLLAVSDSFLSFCYGPVIAMDVIKNRLQIVWLTRLWWSYIGTLLALCHVSMTFSSFLIILATIERYLITERSRLLQCFRRNRPQSAFFMFIAAVLLRGTAFFEVELGKNGNCTGLTEYEPVLTSLVDTWIYGTLFRFYVRNIVTVFIPFTLLAFLNVRIVYTLRIQQRTAAMFRFGHSDHKKKVRSATTLLVLIVCSYLMANFVNVVVTGWEYIDIASTQTEELYDVYEFLTDIVSVLYIFVCATRLAVYLVCNMELREAFTQSLCRREKKTDAVRAYSFKTSTKPKKRMLQVGTEFDHVVIAIAKPWLVAKGSARGDGGGEWEQPAREEYSTVLSNSSSSPVLEMTEPMIIANVNTMSPGQLHKSASN
ncbi:hypothetical protein L596_002327 [Steinernema carpocapsae]|uniref:G-protein coupled receptors family 1 profile domain-containing protein n=1 Tax=Steinernema carpocapsae TaxID=34508 RepID=A0A4U8UNU7_STECR|nr:hypothetical protein L596_002327 [Steinernema carpocapsae]